MPSWMRVVNASWRPDATLPCYTMAVLPHPDIVAGSLCRWGAWEINSPHDFEDQAGVARGTLPAPPNGIFLDIGAHIAHFSYMFAQTGYSSIAFEPVPRNGATIRATQCLNPRTHVTLFPTALGSPTTRGPCIATSGHDNTGNAEVRCGPSATCDMACGEVDAATSSQDGRSRCATCSSVRMSTLDEALPVALNQHLANATQRPPIIAAKLDTEGMECSILDGGKSLFAVHRPLVILIEVRSRSRWRSRCVQRFAAAHGYRLTYRQKSDNAFMVRRDVKIVSGLHNNSDSHTHLPNETLVVLPEWKRPKS